MGEMDGSGKGQSLLDRLDAAWQRRAALHEARDLDVYRLVHGHGDGLPGLNIDRLGTCAVVWMHGDQPYDLNEVVAWLEARMAPAAVLHKGPGVPRGGVCVKGVLPAEELVVDEFGLRFALEPLAAQNMGLFLDARPARQWLRAHSEGRLVLNTFAYTGSLGVAARAGGARGCVQVDLQRAQLVRARRNHELNGQVVDDRDLMRADCLRWLRRSKRRIDALVLDPPPRLPGNRSGDPQAWRSLVRHGAALLEPGGWILGLLNRRGLTRAHWEARVLEAAEDVGVTLEVFWRGQSGLDFAEDDPEAILRMTAFRAV